MNLHNLKKVSDYEIEEWLRKSIPELSVYQKEKIRDNEIVRFAPFYFYEKRQKVNNVFLRLTIIFMPIVWVLLFVSLPFNFFITGKWGYNYSKVEWFDIWKNAVGL